MREFSHSYKILLSLFDILNIFYDNIWVNIEVKMCHGVINSNTIIKCVEMSYKLNKIWLKKLNSRIFKVKGLNWSNILKID